jgi:hypothetical protein
MLIRQGDSCVRPRYIILLFHVAVSLQCVVWRSQRTRTTKT